MIKDEPDRSKARRDALRIIAGGLLLGGWPAANPAHAQTGNRAGCVLTPAQTEGPYFVDERLDRSDVREDPATGAARPGAVLTLDLGVAAVDGARCMPLRGAIVDIWQCDALGNYSDVNDSRGQRFLRGYQATDANGRVRFTTIYPGAYPGRAVHIHFKIRRSGCRAQHRIHVAVLLRRCADRSRACDGRVCGCCTTTHAQRARRPLPGRRQRSHARRDRQGRRVRRHVRHRRAYRLASRTQAG